MPIFALGINYKTAAISLREKALFSRDKLPLYLTDLVQQENIRNAVLLSTCNRSELYCEAPAADALIDWFCRQYPEVAAELRACLYCYQDQAALEHMMSVACGLDSMVLGESQILGQMKDAFSESCAQGAVGTIFNRLFQYIFAVAKEVRTSTAIGACPVSVSSAAVQFVKKTWATNLNDAVILIMGAGVMAELFLRHLKPSTDQPIYIVNRSIEHAATLAQKYAARVVEFKDLTKYLAKVDIVIAATGATEPVVTADVLPPLTKPLLIVDIALPRAIAPVLATTPYVQLFDLDDLKPLVAEHLDGRAHAAQKAQELIKQKTAECMGWLNSYAMVSNTIRAYRAQIEALCQLELSKAERQLQRGSDPQEVLQAFAQALTNKLMHTPSVQLRQAGNAGRLEFLQLVQELFAIDELEAQLI